MNRFNSKSSYRDSFAANPVFMSVKSKPATKKKKAAPKGAIKQYGDAGYVPSTGAGVTY